MENNQHQRPPPSFEDGSRQISSATTHHLYPQQHQPPPSQLQPQQSYFSSNLRPNLNNMAGPQGFLSFYQPNRFGPFMPPIPQLRQQHQLMMMGPVAVVQEQLGSSGVATPTHSTVPPIFFNADLGGSSMVGGSRGGAGTGEDASLPSSTNSLGVSEGGHGWQNREDSGIRQPFGKRLSTEEGNGVKETEVEKVSQMKPSLESRKALLFGELEAICRTPPVTDEPPAHENLANAAAVVDTTMGGGGGGDGGDKNETAPPRMDDDDDDDEEEMNSMAAFFEGLLRQLMDHQENLSKKFIAAIEKLNQERVAREEEWRKKEMERLEEEAALRAKERALASQREASIIAFLERLTGQTIPLPPPPPPPPPKVEPLQCSSGGAGGHGDLMSRRWPKEEVDALIEIRTSLEPKFQQPGYKGPVWDEISAFMGSMGFNRTGKRCKEKWENINKYFRKSRENLSLNSNSNSSRKKPKTCQYFDKLDQLYTKPSGGVAINAGSNSCSSSSEQQQQEVQIVPPAPALPLTTGNLNDQVLMLKVDDGGNRDGEEEEEEGGDDDE